MDRLFASVLVVASSLVFVAASHGADAPAKVIYPREIQKCGVQNVCVARSSCLTDAIGRQYCDLICRTTAKNIGRCYSREDRILCDAFADCK